MVLGNHDVRWLEGGYEEAYNCFMKHTQMPHAYYDKWICGYHFIFLSTEEALKDEGRITKGQLTWLKDKLRGVDEYIKELLDYVESSGEPTVIAMFGDHLPSLKIINDDESVLKDGNKYLADFFIWDNIGLPKENVNMEAEEFTTYILEKLNMVAGVMPTVTL